MLHTQTQKQIHIFLLGLVLATAAVVVPRPALANTFVTFYQQLRPQACTPELSITASGEFTLRLADGCGQLVLPGAPGASVPTGSGGAIVIPRASGLTPVTDIFYGAEPVYLESDPALQPRSGYMLLAERYGRYTFYLTGDNRAIAPRSMQVTGVGSDHVLVRFWPGQQLFVLSIGNRSDLDITGDGVTDVKLRLQQIGSDGVILLHVAFPPQPASVITSATEDRFAFFAAVTAFSALALSIYHYLNNIYLRRHALPAKLWWVAHPHEPFR